MKNIFLIRGLEVETTAHDSEHKGHTHNTRFTRWNPIPTLVQMAFIFYKVHDTLQIFNDAISIGLLCQTPWEAHTAEWHGTREKKGGEN